MTYFNTNIDYCLSKQEDIDPEGEDKISIDFHINFLKEAANAASPDTSIKEDSMKRTLSHRSMMIMNEQIDFTEVLEEYPILLSKGQVCNNQKFLKCF